MKTTEQMKKIIKEKSWILGNVVIRLSKEENKDIWIVEAINRMAKKHLEKEFLNESEALEFYNFLVKQQDDFKP